MTELSHIAGKRAHPTLIVLEDLHWGHGHMLECIHAALRPLEKAPLLVLAWAAGEPRAAPPRRPTRRSRTSPTATTTDSTSSVGAISARRGTSTSSTTIWIGWSAMTGTRCRPVRIRSPMIRTATSARGRASGPTPTTPITRTPCRRRGPHVQLRRDGQPDRAARRDDRLHRLRPAEALHAGPGSGPHRARLRRQPAAHPQDDAGGGDDLRRRPLRCSTGRGIVSAPTTSI
jgi:hypothetical protein